MTTNVLGDNVEPTTQDEFASFVFGYLNCVAEMIGQTIRQADKESPNEEAKDFTSKLAASYMANVSQSICKEMGLPSGSFNKYMTKEIRNACEIIAREAGNSLDVLDSKMNELKESHSSYKRERNEWEDRHGN
jgi:hypothetical protein